MIVGSTPDKDSPSRNKVPYNKKYTNSGSATKVTTLVTTSKPQEESAVAHTPDSKGSSTKCPLCSSPHKLTRCKRFNGKTPQQRKEFAMQARLCHNCLGRNHLAVNCRSDNTCSNRLWEKAPHIFTSIGSDQQQQHQ